jgi:Double zinc ribbon
VRELSGGRDGFRSERGFQKGRYLKREASGTGLWPQRRPHYYCEGCGAEVRKDARVCPRCGRFFSSVKCPRCGYVGQADDFVRGCPTCGYAEAPNASPDPIRPLPPEALPLPWWAFVAAAVVIVALVFALFQSLR